MPKRAACAALLVAVSVACSSGPATREDRQALGKTSAAIQDGEPDSQHLYSAVVRITGATGCSGTLVAQNIVISAAHCFDANAESNNAKYHYGHSFKLISGDIQVRFDNAMPVANFPPPQPMTVHVSPSTVIVHPNWVAGMNDAPMWDIAVVKLPQRVSLKYVQPMRIGTSNPISPVQYADGENPPTPACLAGATDPTTCNWDLKNMGVEGYGQTSSGHGLPVGSVPEAATVIPTLGLVPLCNQFGDPDCQIAVGFDESFFRVPAPDCAQSILPGDSGGPEFVGPVFDSPNNRLFWSQNDPLLTTVTLVGVNSEVEYYNDLIENCAIGFDDARVTTPQNMAFLAPYLDNDGDKVPDYLDTCAGVADTTNRDDDKDGIGHVCDNCPGVYNPDQSDQDKDGVGDLCDKCPWVNDKTAPDQDRDGVPDACDYCPCDPNEVNPWTDGDKDGVCGACDPTLSPYCATYCANNPADNCPHVPNPAPQPNCNLDSENAQGAAVVGDACDPVPCPQFSPEIQWSQPPPGPLQGCATITETVKDLSFSPIGSHYVDSSPQRGAEKPVTVPSTLYRYCFDVPNVVDCSDPSLVTDNDLTSATSRATEGLLDYWHRTSFAFPFISPDGADGPLEYKSGQNYTRDWLWQSDIAYWQSTAWGTGMVPDEPTGVFWAHGDTQVGTSDQSLGTGVHPLAGSSTPASMLANHYQAVSPKEEVRFCGSFAAPRPLPWRYCPQCGVLDQSQGCPLCGPPSLRPFQELDPFISRVIVQAEVDGQPTEGVLLPEGDLGIAQGTLTPALEQDLSDGSVWLNGVEPSMLTGRGPFMPAAVALSADGTELVHAAFEGGRGFMAASDVVGGEPGTNGLLLDSSAMADPPSPRSDFKGVYSHAAAQVFVVGGKDLATGADSANIWTLPLVGGADWYRVPGAQYQPADVLAATYLWRRQRLWVLDAAKRSHSFREHDHGHDCFDLGHAGHAGEHGHRRARDCEPGHSGEPEGPIRTRLVELDPASGAMRSIGDWPRTDRFDSYWLVPDRDGEVLLAASSSRSHAWIVARLDPETGNVTALERQSGELAAAPVVDSEGYWFIVRSRQNGLDSALRLAALPPAHRSAGDLDDCF